MKDPYKPKYIVKLNSIRLELPDLLFLLYEGGMLTFFYFLVEYPDFSAPGSFPSVSKEQGVMNDYDAYRDIAVMVYIGFGYLMMFLKRSGYTSIGGTLLLCVASMQWALMVNGCVGWVQSGFVVNAVHVDVRALIRALFSVVSVMITFGVVIGKLSTLEMIFASVFEVGFIGLNNYLSNGRTSMFQTMDTGGSMFIHMFGAYFGMAFAWALRNRHTKRKPVVAAAAAAAATVAAAAAEKAKAKGTSGDNDKNDDGSAVPAAGCAVGLAAHPLNTSKVTSDLLAMVGTVFLFIYWPSFNAAFASVQNSDNNSHGPGQMRALLNTILAQAAGAFSGFLFSRILRQRRPQGEGAAAGAASGGTQAATTTQLPPPPPAARASKYHMRDIQQATLAAGVAMGASADQVITVAGSMTVGVLAALLSVVGAVHVQGWLERRFRVSDTCGMHNAYGMPGLLGGLVSVLVMGVTAARSTDASSQQAALGMPLDQWFPHGNMQYVYQLVGLGISLGVAIVGGLVTAGLCQLLRPLLNTIPDKQQPQQQRSDGDGDGDGEGDDDDGNSCLFTDKVEWFVPEEVGDEREDQEDAERRRRTKANRLAALKKPLSAMAKVFVIQQSVVAEMRKSMEKPAFVQEMSSVQQAAFGITPTATTAASSKPDNDPKNRKPAVGTAVMI